ncbi:cytochrome P450, partial [Frankia sp. CpI1-P]
MGELVRARKATAGNADSPEGLLDVLIAAADNDGTLTETELHSLAMTLLIGGFETTGGVISNVITTLLTQRSHWEALVTDPSGMPNAIEELLRYHPLSMTFPRVATEDIDLGGFVVRAGEVVVVPLAAMSRDPAVFTD